MGHDPPEADANLGSVVTAMIEGQFGRPVRVVELNIIEGWARDVSADVAQEVAARARSECLALPRATRLFVEAELGDRFVGAD